MGAAERWTGQNTQGPQGPVGWVTSSAGREPTVPAISPFGNFPTGSRGVPIQQLCFSHSQTDRMRAHGLTNGSVQGSPRKLSCRVSGYLGIRVAMPCPVVSQPSPATPVCAPPHVHSWGPCGHANTPLGVKSHRPEVPACTNAPVFP